MKEQKAAALEIKKKAQLEKKERVAENKRIAQEKKAKASQAKAVKVKGKKKTKKDETESDNSEEEQDVESESDDDKENEALICGKKCYMCGTKWSFHIKQAFAWKSCEECNNWACAGCQGPNKDVSSKFYCKKC